MKNKKEFAKRMTAFSEIFDREVTQTMRAVYWAILEPFSDTECERAFDVLLKASKFFPKPAEFLEVLNGDVALRAWLKLEKAVRCIGGSESVQFDDPAIHSVVEVMGGWESVDDWLQEEMKWKQKDFERLYLTVKSRTDHVLYLVGKFEKENRGVFDAFVKPPIRVCEMNGDIKLVPLKERLSFPEPSNTKMIEEVCRSMKAVGGCE